MKRMVVIAYSLALLSTAWGQDPGSIVPGTSRGYSMMLTTWGVTGLISVPTAYSTQKGMFVVGSTFANGLRGPVASYGLIKDVEVGGSVIERNGTDGEPFANGKVTLRLSNFRNVEIGVGVIDAADTIRRTGFVVASADLIPIQMSDDVLGKSVGLKVHGGYGTGLFKDKLIGGAELVFNSKFALLGEYDGTSANAALRYSPDARSAIQAGVRDNGLYFGIGFSF